MTRPGAERTSDATAQLTAIAGAAQGEVFRLEGDELVVGRSSENPVSIADTSVSRKHALVRRTDRGWALSDLGSGNGTLLNDEPVTDETELSEGDVITMGDTQLRFSSGAADTQEVEPPEAPLVPARSARPPVRTARSGAPVERAGSRGRPVRPRGRAVDDARGARQARRKVFISMGAALVVILALLVGWKAIENKRRSAAHQVEEARKAHRDQMAEMFKEAKALVKQGRWTEAKEKLEEVQATDPDFEPQQLAKYVENATQEIPNEVALEAARRATAAGQLGDAAEALKGVKATLQSDTALRVAREALDAKFSVSLAEARALAATRELATATRVKAMADDLVKAKPDDRDARTLSLQIDGLVRDLSQRTQVVAAPETPWVEAQQRFRTGDASGAQALAQACASRQARCRELEADMKEWSNQSKRVEELSETELGTLFDLDRKISGGTSSEQSGPIRTQLVSKFFVKASQAKTTGNWSRAIEYARRVLSAAPDHHGAQALVHEARTQAKEVYLRGYQLMQTNPDEAMRLFKEVMTMTPADDEYNQKAKARMAELQGK